MSDVEDAFLKRPVERRSSRRRACRLQGELVGQDGRAVAVAVLDLTAEGARVALRRQTLLPTDLILCIALADGPVTYRADLLWRSGLNVGLALSDRQDLGLAARQALG
jgi:hypothetical protein